MVKRKLIKTTSQLKKLRDYLGLNLLELQLAQGDSMKIHPEIREPMSQFTDFWWGSMGSKDLRPEDKSGNPNSCEEYID